MTFRLSHVFGATAHMVRIGQSDEHTALRTRNEARLAAMKAAGRLTEDRHEQSASDELSARYRDYYRSLRNTTEAERVTIAQQQAIASRDSFSRYAFAHIPLGQLWPGQHGATWLGHISPLTRLFNDR